MQPSEVDVPRSIMDPPPPPQRRRGFPTKLVLIIVSVTLAVAVAGAAAFFLLNSGASDSTQDSNQETAQTATPVPTPEEKDITENATTKQVAVDGRTFTHIVPENWKANGSEGDIVSPDFEVEPGSGKFAVAAIRYNQGTYAMNPAAPAGTFCDQIVADSEVIKVSPNDERFINYCGKKGASGTAEFIYVLFTKYSYKAGKTLTPTEQSDLLQNVLLYGRIQPPDENPYKAPFEEVSEITEFKEMVGIFQNIKYVEVQ